MKLTNNLPIIKVVVSNSNSKLKEEIMAVLSTGNKHTKLNPNVMEKFETIVNSSEFKIDIIGTNNSKHSQFIPFFYYKWNFPYDMIIGLDILQYCTLSINGINQTFEIEF